METTAGDLEGFVMKYLAMEYRGKSPNRHSAPESEWEGPRLDRGRLGAAV
jgi:hypothetical protein